MHLRALLFTICGTLTLVPALAASDRPEHFRGAPAKSLAEALSNLEVYNAALEDLLSRDQLSPKDLGKVHQLSYSLENALERVGEELDVIEDALEAVHKGSEALQYERVRDSGRLYLDKTAPLTNR